MQPDHSYRGKTWRSLKKNIPALLSAFVIIIASLTALFAYYLAPDNSPNGDWQTVEIQSCKPGFVQSFLVLPGPQQQAPGWWGQLLNGVPVSDKYVPICDYTVSGNQLSYRRRIDEDTCLEERISLQAIGGGENFSKNIIQREFLLGTDIFGRDILSRLIIGTRVSLFVGLVAVIVSLLIGTILGMLAGYYRGRIDDFISWLINVTWSIPTLLLVFAITLAIGKGHWQVFVAVGLTMWVSVARLVRGQLLSIRKLEYVEAARVLGFSDRRIMFRHILPNITGPLLVISAGNFASAILVESGLSFLGLGVQPPQPSWGAMIRENSHYILTDKAILAFIPGIAIMILVLACNILGNALRDALDVRD